MRTLSPRRGALMAAALLAFAAGAAPGYARSSSAPRTGRPTILVLPFDLFDYSLDQRAATVIPLHRWVAHLAGHISGDLNADRALDVLAPGIATAALRTVRANYAHPTACRQCVLAVAHRLGADLAVVGQVHKLSNLITYFDIQVDDARTGQVLHVISMRADGADSNTMWKYIAQNIAQRVESAAARAH